MKGVVAFVFVLAACSAPAGWTQEDFDAVLDYCLEVLDPNASCYELTTAVQNTGCTFDQAMRMVGLVGRYQTGSASSEDVSQLERVCRASRDGDSLPSDAGGGPDAFIASVRASGAPNAKAPRTSLIQAGNAACSGLDALLESDELDDPVSAVAESLYLNFPNDADSVWTVLFAATYHLCPEHYLAVEEWVAKLR